MWTIAEIKERGKRAFKGNYWLCVLVAFLMAVFTTGAPAVLCLPCSAAFFP